MEAIINNLSGEKLDRSMIRKLAKRVSKKKWKVSISFVPRSAMKKRQEIGRECVRDCGDLWWGERGPELRAGGVCAQWGFEYGWADHV